MKEDFLFNHEVAVLKERGITLNDLKGEEVVALVNAVEKLRNPFTGVNLDVCGMPVEVGNAKLWKLTVGATVWLAEYPSKWWMERGKPKAYFWAMVYACIHGREPNLFPTTEDAAHEAITRTAVQLAVYEEELVEAVNKCLEIREAEPRKKKQGDEPDVQTDWASIIARLEGQTGIPADQWCWKRSADYALRVHEDLRRFASIQAGDKAARMRDETDMATSNLAKLRAAIVSRVDAERKEKAE